MSNNQAVLITYLKDILFSEGEICQNVENREHIFEMADSEGTSLGYISLYDLKAYVFEHEEEAGTYKIKNIDGSHWVSVFEHPYFQRRKPQLVAMNTISEDSDQQFYILKHGQKTGPYEKYELVTMLEEKDILLTDMVSYNAGHTWMKLYQVEDFDRRVLKESDQLPGVPSQVISQPNSSVLATSPETEAISSLAYLSNAKRGKTVEREKIVESFKKEERTEAPVRAGASSLYKWLLVVSIVGIGYFLFHIKNQLISPFKPEQPAIGEQAQMLTPVEMTEPMAPQTNPSALSQLGERRRMNQVNDQGRSPAGKFETRQFQPIQPIGPGRKSFMETGKFQEIKNSDADAEDPNYFYDNTSAIELDPVRSQVSKETTEGDGPIPSSDGVFESEISN